MDRDWREEEEEEEEGGGGAEGVLDNVVCSGSGLHALPSSVCLKGVLIMSPHLCHLFSLVQP